MAKVLLTLSGMVLGSVAGYTNMEFNLQSFRVNLTDDVPRMMQLVQGNQLPEQPEYAGLGNTAGVDLDVLKAMKTEWLTEFDWEAEQAKMNSFNHFTAVIEGLTIHFIHQRSSDPNAIPLILNHGWPGSFLEFTSIIKNLTEAAATSKDAPVSFHAIVPSLPGFAFSSAPPANWTIADTARVYNTLMTEVLGYDTYATHGTDWGCGVSYSLYDNFSNTTRAAHFSYIPFYPLTAAQLAENNITLTSSLEEFELQVFEYWAETGQGYLQEQSTKPNTIGLALYDNPVGQLAWMGEKSINWSDPRAGTGPSILTHNEILTSVSLYYLTKSFVSSVFIYFQNVNGFQNGYTKANTDAPLLFSAFKYNNAFWPPALVARVGNLVQYRNHDFGGHFQGLDNPPALLKDIRDIGDYWNRSFGPAKEIGTILR